MKENDEELYIFSLMAEEALVVRLFNSENSPNWNQLANLSVS
ncbi:hypothetical protein CISIN_1g0358991mg, partial [Citrus sinensis]